MDRKKVQAIKEQEPLMQVPKLRSFLRLINYYQKFIKGYFARVTPLTELLMKNKQWAQAKECQEAFEDLKVAIIKELMLAFTNFSKPFEVYIDASDFPIKGLLM